MASKYFSVYDYLVLILVFLISILIGIFQARPPGYFKNKFKILKSKLWKKNKTNLTDKEPEELEINELEQSKEGENKMNEYLIGSKNIHLLPVALSILASIFSSNTLIGNPAEVYQYGTQILIQIIPDTISCLIAGFVFLPILGKLSIITMSEYFQLRFNSKIVRIISLIAYSINSLLKSSTVIYGTGISLSSVTGLDPFLSMTILGVITIGYTALGGIRGVIWSDVFQLVVMFGGLIFIVIKGSYDVGGMSKVWQIASDGGRVNFFDFRPNPLIRQTFWSIVFGDLFSSTMSYSIDQSTIQRFSATETVRYAKYAMLITTFGSAMIVFLSGLIGVIIYATYADCDPLLIPGTTNLKNPNQLLAYYTNDKFSSMPGISGFVQGTLISAALSTVSSILNGQVAILWKDCFQHISYFQNFNDVKKVRLAKIIVIVFGVIIISFSFAFASNDRNLTQIGILFRNSIIPTIAVIFILGSCLFFGNYIGAIAGGVVSLGVGFWILIGNGIVQPRYIRLPSKCGNITDFAYYNDTSGEAINVSGFSKFYSISFHVLFAIIFSVGLLVGIIVSLATGGLKNKLPDSLVLFNRKSNKISNASS